MSSSRVERSSASHSQMASAESAQPSGAAGRDHARVASPLETRSSKAPAPGRLAQLNTAVRKLSATDHRCNSAPAGSKREKSLAAARLEVVRELAAISHGDPVPVPNVSESSAELIVGGRCLVNLAQAHPDLEKRDKGIVQAMVNAGELHHRMVDHFGMKHGKVRLKVKERLDLRTSHGQTRRSTFGIEVVMTSRGEATDLVHESMHLAQHGDFGARGQRPRQDTLSVATSLPEGNASQYLSQPRELQAFYEAAVVAERVEARIADRAHGVQPPPAEETGMDQLIKCLADAGTRIDGRSPGSLLLSQRLHQGRKSTASLAKFDLKAQGPLGVHMQQVLKSMAVLDGAMRSPVWTPQHSQALKAVVSGLGEGTKQTGERRLASIAKVLRRAVRRLERDDVPNGKDAGRAYGLRPRPQWLVDRPTHDVGKNHPVGVLWQVQADPSRGTPAAWGSEQAARQALQAAKVDSGFLMAADALQAKLEDGALPAEREVADAVVLLAAQLTGRGANFWTSKLIPTVRLLNVEDQHMDLSGATKLTLGPGQRRKAVFDAASWQILIPRPLLNADRTSMRSLLAGLAVDVAHAVVTMGSVDRDALRQPLQAGIRRGWLTHIQAKAQATDASALQAMQEDPASAAAVFNQLARQHPGGTASHWHAVVRPMVKQDLARGLTTSEATYLSEQYARHTNPLVAFRRAMKADTAEPVQAPDQPDPGHHD